MQAEIYWADGEFPGRVAVAGRPGGGTSLPGYMAAYRAAGLDILVSTLADPELSELSLEGAGAAAAEAGLAYRHFPIPNLGVPPFEVAVPFLTSLADAVRGGASVAVHCFGGVGRSPMIATSVLALLGVDTDEAWRRVQDGRGRPIPDTRVQRAWVAEMLAHVPAARTTG